MAIDITIKHASEAKKISKHFRARELMCPCCRECIVDAELLEILEEIRYIIGEPIHVTSGYRCEKHNTEVRGARNSQHRLGKAADIWAEDTSPEELYNIACNQMPGYGGVIKYKTFVHIDTRDKKYRGDKSND